MNSEQLLRRRLIAAATSCAAAWSMPAAVGTAGLMSQSDARAASAGKDAGQEALAAPVQFPIIVLNSRDADVSLIHPVTHKVLTRVSTGKEPHHLYPTPDNRQVVIGNAMSDSLTFLDPATGKVVMSLQGIADPYHLGFSPDQNIFVTCANRLDHVDVYRRSGNGDQLSLKLLSRFDLAKTPSHLVFTEDSRVVFCTLQESDELVAIDLKKLVVLWRMKTGRLPAGVAISPDSKLVFVGCMGENNVQVIEPRIGNSAGPRLVAAIKTGDGAHAFRNQGNKRHLWVTNRVANTLSKIDMSTLKVEAEIRVSGGPDCMDIHSSGKQLWVTQRWTRSVALVDLDQSKVVKRVTVGKSPHGVYLHDRADLL